MARQAKGGISRHTKGYRITLGKTESGKPRTFWLGQNLSIASQHSDLLESHWKGTMQPEGRVTWSADDLKDIDACMVHIKRTLTKKLDTLAEARKRLLADEAETKEHWALGEALPDASESPRPATDAPMLHAMMDRFNQWFGAKADRSISSKTRLKEIINLAKKTHADIAVSKIDRLWIDEAVQHWKNRPAHKKTGKPISTYTVKTVLQHLSGFFNWLSDNEEVTGFSEPKKMAKLFKYRPEQIDEIDQLTMAEVKLLYQAASDQQRLYLLAGATCGMTQQELAATTADEFDFAKSIWTHKRHKTKIAGSHWIGPEFVALLKARISTTPANPGNLAFLTTDARPLVTFNGSQKASDSVRQSWDDLLANVELPKGRRPTFKMLRKFLAGWINDRHGLELAQIALQHKSQTVLAKHYAKQKNFDPLHVAQKQLHAEMTAAGVFAKEEKKKAA